MMTKKVKVFATALMLIIGLGFTPAQAQFGKKLKEKMAKMKGGGEGGEINKDKLPGPYYTSDIQLFGQVEAYQFPGQDFYLEDNKFAFANGKAKDYLVCRLAPKSKNAPNLASGDKLYGATNNEFMYDITGEGKKVESPRIVRTIHLKNENVFLFYGPDVATNDDPRNMEGGTYGYMIDHSKITIYYALAPTKELAAEWNSEKGLKRIYAAEDGVKEIYLAGMKNKIADVRMPKPGKMDSNTALHNKIKSQLTAQLERDGATLKRMMITADNWEIVRNKVTGEILYRHIWGYLADSNPDRGEVSCMVFGFYYTEKYQGNGNYAEGNGKVDCCSQDARYGPYIACENIDK